MGAARRAGAAVFIGLLVAADSVFVSSMLVVSLELLFDPGTLRDLRDRTLIVFMLSTGVRLAEALSLMVAHFRSVDG